MPHCPLLGNVVEDDDVRTGALEREIIHVPSYGVIGTANQRDGRRWRRPSEIKRDHTDNFNVGAIYEFSEKRRVKRCYAASCHAAPLGR